MNSSRPIVFVSSVIKGSCTDDPGLAPIRGRVTDLVTKDFGWNCICSGITDSSFWGAPLSACLQAVDSCDLFLAIFWESSGTILDYQGISVTEFELYRAMNNRKAIRAYVLESTHRDPPLTQFLSVLANDPHLGQYVRKCSPRSVLGKIREDLTEFGRIYRSSRSRKQLSFQPYIDVYLEDLRKSNPPRRLSVTYTPTTFSPDVVMQNLDHMAELHAKSDHMGILDVGYSTLRMLQLRPPQTYPHFRGAWLRLLEYWFGACSWLGIVDGPFGSIVASRATMEVSRLCENFVDYHHAAGMLGSSLYILATSYAAKASLADERKWKRACLSRSTALIKRALSYNTLVYYRSPIADPCVTSTRASILLHLGHHDQALNLYKLADRQAETTADRVRLKAEIGRMLVICRAAHRGLHLIENSVAESCNLDVSVRMRVLRNYAEALNSARHFIDAEAAALQALTFANGHGYLHQAELCCGLLARTERLQVSHRDLPLPH